MSRISFDRNAAEMNARRAQTEFFRASVREEYAAKRHASNKRLAAMAGLVFGLVYALASAVFGF